MRTLARSRTHGRQGGAYGVAMSFLLGSGARARPWRDAHNRSARERPTVEAYDRVAADLRSLWPANGRINSSRQDQSFDEIPGERRRRFEYFCPDYERTRGQNAIDEPRDAVKGDLARSILSMHIATGCRCEPTCGVTCC